MVAGMHRTVTRSLSCCPPSSWYVFRPGKGEGLRLLTPTGIVPSHHNWTHVFFTSLAPTCVHTRATTGNHLLPHLRHRLIRLRSITLSHEPQRGHLSPWSSVTGLPIVLLRSPQLDVEVISLPGVEPGSVWVDIPPLFR